MDSVNFNINNMPLDVKKAYINNLRLLRNKFLNDTDKYLLNDFPITDDKKNEIIKYRKDLRDFMNLDIVKIENLNDNIMNYFPKKPLFI